MKPTENVPLVVDLDGTLVRSDLLVETGFAHLAADPRRLFALVGLLRRGKAALKAGIAVETAVDATLLPYDDRVLELIAAARGEGRKIFVASAGDARPVAAVAAHIGADGWFASDGRVNLSGDAKARRLVEAFGEKNFDYVGNDRRDLAVWAVARRGWAVEPSSAVRRELASRGADVAILEPVGGGAREWIRLARVHQWVKNALVFVPMVTSHHVTAASVFASILAFLAFSFAASAVYVLNDLVDVEADRRHPTKRFRPLAVGRVPILAAPLVAGASGALAFVLAFAASPRLALVLLGYVGLAVAYTFVLKRKMLVDIVTLAGLYALRVLGGAAAIAVPVSEWLFAFSLFFFTSLALVKRYVELAARADADLPDPSDRDYLKSDLVVVAALAAAAGFNAVTVFALYVSSEAVRPLYPHPQVLWLICPILMYWIGRALMMASRRQMDDDPILFALRDRNSLAAAALVGVVLLVAAVPW